MDLQFDPFDSDASLPEQRELFRNCFPEAGGSSVESTDHYRWKFHSIRNDPPSYEYCVWQSNPRKLLGYYAALPFRYSVGGLTFSCGMVCDVMTHSAARGKGIFTKIGRYATEDLRSKGVDFTSGYPIRPEVIPGHLKVGWEVAQELPLYLKVLRSNALLKSSIARHFTGIVNVGLKLFALLTRPRVSRSGQARVVIESTADFLNRQDDSYERFFARWSASRKVHLIKDRPFLRWRLGAPESEYHVISELRGTDIEGMAIVRVTELKGIPCLAVLDLMLVEETGHASHGLIRAMESFALSRSCETIGVMIRCDRARRASLLWRGFVRTPFAFKLIIKPLSERAKEARLLDPSMFDVMWIDSDDL